MLISRRRHADLLKKRRNAKNKKNNVVEDNQRGRGRSRGRHTRRSSSDSNLSDISLDNSSENNSSDEENERADLLKRSKSVQSNVSTKSITSKKLDLLSTTQKQALQLAKDDAKLLRQLGYSPDGYEQLRYSDESLDSQLRALEHPVFGVKRIVITDTEILERNRRERVERGEFDANKKNSSKEKEKIVQEIEDEKREHEERKRKQEEEEDELDQVVTITIDDVAAELEKSKKERENNVKKSSKDQAELVSEKPEIPPTVASQDALLTDFREVTVREFVVLVARAKAAKHTEHLTKKKEQQTNKNINWLLLNL
jgi:hypothetical protein